ncbi:putative RNaseIII [Tieghemostelium lacteum]|uniref:Putative RNaseIII n=1 Tax=Tieghemostelium lacteum TaxID=361077 RepID=A0A151Z2W8_TIELA|nr:putative RNaseIII [Tieghemostelium lacteum]|eukprot:KYQ88267.1 putative RNaseIII [Tieghemostelium lacteum]
MTNENEIEEKMDNEFRNKLKQFGGSEVGLALLNNNEDENRFFDRSQVTREEINNHKEFMSKQGDYFAKCIELEEENETLKQKVTQLERELKIQKDLNTTLQKSINSKK